MTAIKEPVEYKAAERLLRCQKTHRYWNPNGWTDNKEEAALFDDIFDAVRVCLDHNLQNVELVLRMPSSQAEVFSTPIR